ncbi:hypothetical protein STVA_15990 [Allostella vacuolata]|nr:hypothetical protein STVA_15990 [Stella vacuolata]
MRLRALIAIPALLGLGACVDPYYDGYGGGYGPSGYVSGSYYGSAPVYTAPGYYGSPGYYPDRRDHRPRYDPPRRSDRESEYRPRPPERPPAYRPPPPSSDRPLGYSGGQTERDAERFNRNRRGPEPGE